MQNRLIYTEQELNQHSKHAKHIILYGEKSLVIIMLRYFLQNGMISRILGLSYPHTEQEGSALLNLPRKPITSYSPNETTDLYILGRNTAQNDDLRSRLSGWNNHQLIQIHYGLLASLSQRDHIPLDFLCVGFTKCGTTSLHTALHKNEEIYLPKRKEILYGRWKNRYIDAPERFHAIYCNGPLPKDCKAGSIEPTYFFQSNFVYETFGTRPKILFLVRNPVHATYSYFIMMMKRSMDPHLRSYYKKYKKFSIEMFHDYIHDYILSEKDQRFCYTKWIQEYLRFYDPASIRVIFLEDLIQDTESGMSEIQEFIGVQPKKYRTLPHSNTGNRVSRNYLSARINGKLQTLRVNLKSSPSGIQKLVTKLFQFLWKFTLIETHVKMSESDRLTLESFYHNSVRELETITGRDLKKLWF